MFSEPTLKENKRESLAIIYFYKKLIIFEDFFWWHLFLFRANYSSARSAVSDNEVELNVRLIDRKIDR